MSGLSNNSADVGSDRLQKAIERNRLRQAKRDAVRSGSHNTASVENKRYKQQEFHFNQKPTKGYFQKTKTFTNKENMSKQNGQRVSVALPNMETQFVNPIAKRKKSTRVSNSASFNYPTKRSAGTTRKKAKRAKQKNALLMKLAWACLIFIFFRLIFADRGLMDYLSMQELIVHKQALIEETKDNNKLISEEINLLRTGSNYQKKMVREKLGFISADEYIVIFSEDSGLSKR